MQNYVDNILKIKGIDGTQTISPRSSITFKQLFSALIEGGNIKKASVLLEVSEDSLEQTVRRHVSKLFPIEKRKVPWDIRLLQLCNVKRCNSCNQIKSISVFSQTGSTCKECDNIKSKAYNAEHAEYAKSRSKKHYQNNKAEYIRRNINRKLHTTLATPIWADLDEINNIYSNCPVGFHVDHIIPLKHDLVCGLHVANNLQYLSAEDTLKKSNTFYV